MTEWQFQPGRAGRLGKGRIFLAGDAAHVFIPTGSGRPELPPVRGVRGAHLRL